MPTIVALASDHAGVDLKSVIVAHLNSRHIAHVDLGPYVNGSVDYPDYADKVCRYLSQFDLRIAAYPAQTDCRGLGILICGTGLGMAMAANRHRFIRCAPVERPSLAEITRKHNDANVIAIGARLVSHANAIEIVDTFLNTEFEGGRHADRIMKF